jgi:hypothetical protein
VKLEKMPNGIEGLRVEGLLIPGGNETISEQPERERGTAMSETDRDPPARPTGTFTLLERREIEARIVGPLIQAFRSEFGDERTLAVVRRVIADLARRSGAELARTVGNTSLTAFASCLDLWKAGEALDLDILEQSETRLDFNVTRCRYAEMYRALGLADLGSSLSCLRDFALIEGFHPGITLTRTQTLMEGAPHCDFRFRVQPASEPNRTE